LHASAVSSKVNTFGQPEAGNDTAPLIPVDAATALFWYLLRR
jgi:hypothetical protein